MITTKQVTIFGALALGALALIASGCGGNSPSSTGTNGSQQGQSPVAQARSEAVAFASCMRSHGVPNFPEPKVSEAPGGGVRVAQVAPASAVNGNSRFKSAQQACQKLQPGGGPGGEAPPIGPAEQEQYLRAAACIRSHGFPNLPDPVFSHNHAQIPHLTDSETNTPAFRQAEQACRSLIPERVRDKAHAGG